VVRLDGQLLFLLQLFIYVSGFVADPLLLWKLKYESLSNCQQSYYKNIGYFGGIYTCEFFFKLTVKFQLFTKTFMLIDCVDVTDIRQTFYIVNTISDIFTNVAGDTIFLIFFKRN
jgi:hypothetical protein